MDKPIHSNGRTPIITGGSSGIEKSLVNRFCKENIKTAFADIVASISRPHHIAINNIVIRPVAQPM
jgi:NADP-dependent 3-hydroxy acid dehydrogenase YdfG